MSDKGPTYIPYYSYTPSEEWVPFRKKPNWQARMGPSDAEYHIYLKRGPNILARFMWRVFFNVHWSRIEGE